MLWSLLKIVLFVAAVAGLTLGAGYLMESQGGVQITAGGMEFTLGPLQSVIAAIVLVFVLWVVFKLVSLLIAGSFRGGAVRGRSVRSWSCGGEWCWGSVGRHRRARGGAAAGR